MMSCQVVDEQEARRLYPGAHHRHELIYPGVLVPVWAIELREAFTPWGLHDFARQLMRLLSKWDKAAQRADLVRAICAILKLHPLPSIMPVKFDPDRQRLANRVTDMVVAFYQEHAGRLSSASLQALRDEARK